MSPGLSPPVLRRCFGRLADMAKALHVLEIMESFQKSSEQKALVPLTSHYEKSAPMAHPVMEGVLEE